MAESMESSKAEHASLSALPDEVAQQILSYLSPRDVALLVQPISKRWNRLGNEPLLWRHYCRVSFRYWNPEHEIKQKLRMSVSVLDWKELYIYRHTIDRTTSHTLDSILAGQVDRIGKFETVGKFGYDAKDALLRHCQTDVTADDGLARKYYANSLLDYVHRSKALAEWWKIVKGEHLSLERALSCFDMFVLHDQKGDLLEISDLLDDLVPRLRSAYPGLDNFPIRKRALAINAFLQANNLTGLTDSEVTYRDMQNNYIGIALQDVDGGHPSLPLISVAIFSALANRVGIDARCCGVPTHVYAVVYSKPLETLDGKELAVEETSPEVMYLDPWRSKEEVPVENLHHILRQFGLSSHSFAAYLGSSGVGSLVVRTSRNIIATVGELENPAANVDNHPTMLLHGNPFADMESAFYSALWANFLLNNTTPHGYPSPTSQFIPLIMERVERMYPMDVSFIEQYVCPSLARVNQPIGRAYMEIMELLRVFRSADSRPKQLRMRKPAASDTRSSHERVKYKVGQVFNHKRYPYQAVITGWDIECEMGTEWIDRHGVDQLPRGRHQSFYHVLVEDKTIRYVAEENIELITPENPSSLMSLAGQYFKRWDKDNHVFVSNIKDEYPDD